MADHSWSQVPASSLMKSFVRSGVKDSESLRCVSSESPKAGEVTWMAAEYLKAYACEIKDVQSVWNGKTSKSAEVPPTAAQEDAGRPLNKRFAPNPPKR